MFTVGESVAVLYMVSLWQQDTQLWFLERSPKAGTYHSLWNLSGGSLGVSQAKRRMMCSKAGIPCCTFRGTGMQDFGKAFVSLLPGTAAEMCSQGCPGLSFRAGFLHPQGLCAGPGTLLPARVTLSLPEEV